MGERKEMGLINFFGQACNEGAHYLLCDQMAWLLNFQEPHWVLNVFHSEGQAWPYKAWPPVLLSFSTVRSWGKWEPSSTWSTELGNVRPMNWSRLCWFRGFQVHLTTFLTCSLLCLGNPRGRMHVCACVNMHTSVCVYKGLGQSNWGDELFSSGKSRRYLGISEVERVKRA